MIEAIIEQVEPKRALYARLEKLLPEHAIIASNTSGIPMKMLTEGRVGVVPVALPRHALLQSAALSAPARDHPDAGDVAGDDRRRRGSSATACSARASSSAKDVPGFVANRLGVYGMVLAIRLMEKHDLTIDEADVLTGVLTGRSKSATFRTADLSGIDVIGARHEGVERHDRRGLLAVAAGCSSSSKAGRVGEKSGAGFYKRVGKEIQTLDWKTGEYKPQAKPDDRRSCSGSASCRSPKRLRRHRRLDRPRRRVRERILAAILALRADDDAGDRLRHPGRRPRDGVGLRVGGGPVQADGPARRRVPAAGFAELGLDEPPLLRDGRRDGFYSADGAHVLSLERRVRGRSRASRARSGSPSCKSSPANRERNACSRTRDDASLLDAGDGVAVLEFHSKMNTLGQGVIEMVHRSLDRVERDGLAGLVIGNEDPRTFTAGADLVDGPRAGRGGDWKKLEDAVRVFQDTSLRIRQSPFPGRRRAVRAHARRRMRVLAARRPRAGARRAVHGARRGRRRADSGRRRNDGAAVPLRDGARAVRRGGSVRGGEARVPAHRDGDDEHERARSAEARLPARRRIASR